MGEEESINKTCWGLSVSDFQLPIRRSGSVKLRVNQQTRWGKVRCMDKFDHLLAGVMSVSVGAVSPARGE